MNNIEFIDARELFGDDPIIAEIVAGFLELDDDDRQLIIKVVERLARNHESRIKNDTP